MTSPINPFSFQAIILEKDHILLLTPKKIDTSNSEKAQDHLSLIISQVKEASKNNYSLRNMCSSLSPGSETLQTLSNTQNIESLVKQLSSWIRNQKALIRLSLGKTFYKNISTSLDLNPSSISPKASIIPKSDSPNIPSTSQPFNPRKRWIQEYQEETKSPPKKKSKTTVTNIPITTSSSIPIESSSETAKSYFIQEIVMLQDSIFTFNLTEVLDILEWTIDSYQKIGNIINNSEIVFVDSEIDIHNLKNYSSKILREFTLKSLLQFMQKHANYIYHISDLESQKEASLSYLTLMNDIQISLHELLHIPLNITPSITPQSTPAINPEIKPLSPTFQKTSTNEKYYIAVRTSQNKFHLYAKTDMYDNIGFNKFFTNVRQASLLKSYSSSNNIPNITDHAENDKKLCLRTLYHVTHRNFYCFALKKPFFYQLNDIKIGIQSILNMLNYAYCVELHIDKDYEHHHQDLLNSLVSCTNPPRPLLSEETYLSHISLHKHSKAYTFYIQKTSCLISPKIKKKEIKRWIISLKKHKEKLKHIIEHSKKFSLYIKSNISEWQPENGGTEALNSIQVLEILRKIAQYNLATPLPQLKVDPELDNKSLLRGYQETKEILSSIVLMLQNDRIEAISPTQAHKKNLEHSVQILSIFRPTYIYEIKLHRLPIRKKFESIKKFFSHANKMSRHISNILDDPHFPKIQYDHEILLDPCIFLALLYWGAKYNALILKKKFNGTFYTNRDSHSKSIYNQTITTLSQLENRLLQNWQTRKSLTTPITPLYDISHPVQSSLSLLYKELEEQSSY